MSPRRQVLIIILAIGSALMYRPNDVSLWLSGIWMGLALGLTFDWFFAWICREDKR